jgi:hypothetical protein
MEQAAARGWVTSGFPILIVDEAQDLRPQRLRIVRGLAAKSNVLIAADEFQCLDDQLIPNPAVEWLQVATAPQSLSSIYRTNEPDLVLAARAIRNGKDVPLKGKAFKVFPAPNDVLAATFCANAIAWGSTGNVAIITPSRKGGFAEAIINLVAHRQLGKGNGPYPCAWESSDFDQVNATMQALALPERVSHEAFGTCIRNLHGAFPCGPLGAWADRQWRVRGQPHFERTDVEQQINRLFSLRRHFSHSNKGCFPAMTVHQAKNREFDGVIVIWPHTVGGDAEQKRRLLYNAVTRARNWCLVLTQSNEMLDAPPFKPLIPAPSRTAQLELGLAS